MIYNQGLSPFTREELIDKVSAQMSEKRMSHVLRVEKKALELAEIYGVNSELASIAALTHDYAKERPDEEMKELIKQKAMNLDLLNYGNAIWHGIVGAELVSSELGITHSDILEAIRLHTTGAANMSELAKIIYVADYIEDGRQFPGVEAARELAARDLDEAVAFETRQTLQYLIEKQQVIYPKTIETYNRWVANQ